MNKTALAQKLANRTGLSQKLSAEVLDILFSPAVGVIADALDEGERVTIAGFGSFETRHREARTGRNPRTGEAIEIAAKRHPAFKAAKGLRDRIS